MGTDIRERTGGQHTIELAVDGMTCAACVGRVERRLGKFDGVLASVNLATGRAVVTHPEETPVTDLVAAVERAGYTARPMASEELGGERATERDAVRGLRLRLAVALLLFLPVADLSLVLSLVPSMRFPGWELMVTVLSLPVVAWAAWPFHRAALAALRHGSATMDTLISLGVLAASGWSLWAMATTGGVAADAAGWDAVLHPQGPLYLEVAAGVVTFQLAGRYFEARARRAAGGAMRALGRLQAPDVAVLRAAPGRDPVERRVPVAHLREGDRFVVRPGERIAADGTVLDGAAAVDTSAMTGEPVPVEALPGRAVTGGTIALGGTLTVRADRVGDETRLSRMLRAVERAQVEKAAVQRLVDRVSAVFVPAVLVLAAATLAGWLIAGVDDQGGVAASVANAIAVLIIACPCALGLATPTALMVATGRGAELGIFVAGFRALETVRAADTVLIDKTGTLTTGQMQVTGIATVLDGPDHDELLGLAASVERGSEHPIGRAVLARAPDGEPEPPPVTGFRQLVGLGVQGTVGGREVVVGRRTLLADTTILDGEITSWEESGASVVVVGVDGRLAGALALTDPARPSATPAVAELQRMGLRPVLVTGDGRPAAEALASVVGIEEVHAGVLPDEKIALVQRLRADGHVVAVVGDGVNDAAALTAADLGIAVGSGADVTVDAADLVLVRDDLTVLPTAVRLARATVRTVRGNLAWAFGYNVAALPLAVAGLLNPLLAGAAMALSSLLVVSNSLRLRR